MRKTMIRLCIFVLLLSLSASLLTGCERETQPKEDTAWMKVALITDYADVDDMAYNQIVYEAALAWCEERGVDFTYYQPTGDSTEERGKQIKQAAEDGCNILLLPGYAFAGAIVETVEAYPDVKFIAMDVSEYDLQDAKGTSWDFSWEYPANLYFCVYRTEQAGYLAGYAAVRLGYTKLGFIGGMAVPEVVRYGYGFVQGANDAAKDLGNQAEIELKYAYNNTFCPEDIEAWAARWYEEGTEVILSCGGYIYTYIARAAQPAGGRLIGVDVDIAPIIDAEYGADMTLTSAVKGLGPTVRTQLDKLANHSFEGGRVENLGVVSETPEENYVQLPASTQWNEGFTEKDYEKLVAELLSGTRAVSDSTEEEPTVEILVDYQGTIKPISGE